jgi:hypothetical protein
MSRMGASESLEVVVWVPPMAVPMTVKMPEPMTAPMPSAVRETGPSDLVSAVSGISLSLMSLSIDLVAKIWRDRAGGLRCGKFSGIATIVRPRAAQLVLVFQLHQISRERE